MEHSEVSDMVSISKSLEPFDVTWLKDMTGAEMSMSRVVGDVLRVKGIPYCMDRLSVPISAFADVIWANGIPFPQVTMVSAIDDFSVSAGLIDLSLEKPYRLVLVVNTQGLEKFALVRLISYDLIPYKEEVFDLSLTYRYASQGFIWVTPNEPSRLAQHLEAKK